MAMWIDGGILYTDRERRAVKPTPRKAHKMAEWKVDWWLGREVKVATGSIYVVIEGNPNSAGDTILTLFPGGPGVLDKPDGSWTDTRKPLRMPLVHANDALRKGLWSLL